MAPPLSLPLGQGPLQRLLLPTKSHLPRGSSSPPAHYRGPGRPQLCHLPHPGSAAPMTSQPASTGQGVSTQLGTQALLLGPHPWPRLPPPSSGHLPVWGGNRGPLLGGPGMPSGWEGCFPERPAGQRTGHTDRQLGPPLSSGGPRPTAPGQQQSHGVRSGPSGVKASSRPLHPSLPEGSPSSLTWGVSPHPRRSSQTPGWGLWRLWGRLLPLRA